MRPFLYRLALAWMVVPSFAAPAFAAPVPEALPALCAGAAQSIADSYAAGEFTPAKVDAMSTEERVAYFSGYSVYGAFILHNSLHVPTNEWTTRRVLSEATQRQAAYDGLSVSAPLEPLMPALDQLQGAFSRALASPSAVRLPLPADFWYQLRPCQLNGESFESTIPAFCRVAPLRDCEATFRAVLEYARPLCMNVGRAFTAAHHYIRVVTDPKLVPGLSHYALQALARLRAEIVDGHPTPPSDALTDLTRAFQDAGMEPWRARSAAIDALMAYSTRGAALMEEPITNDLPAIALGVLSTAISYLDRLQLSRGQPSYFLPPGVRTDCAYGKPYHFWMAAGLADLLRRSGYPELTSAVAVYSMGLGYELFGDANGRDPRALLKLERYHPAVNQARLDVFMKALGAAWGVSSDQPDQPRDYRPALYRQFARSGTMSKDGRALLERLVSPHPEIDYLPGWADLIAPAAPLGLIWRTAR
jgi:hypothetical protein